MFLSLYIFLVAQLARASPHCDLTPSKNYPPSASPSVVPAGASTGSLVSASWYASWHSTEFTLQDVSWSKYTSIIYSFAITTPNGNFVALQDSDVSLLPQFVRTAHQNNVLAILSIGGWTGSRYFSYAVGSDANRTAFAQGVMQLVSQYKLDGIEFDWEYPAKQGIGCNVVSTNDSANFLSFLTMLRGQQGAQKLTISAAVSLTPFLDSNGKPMADVSAFAKVLSYIEIMNYDIWGPWSATDGPDAPLNDSCAPTAEGSAMSAVKAWSKAGFPIKQMILGVPSYGHSFRVTPTNALDSSKNIILYAPFNKPAQPPGDKWDSTAGGVDECGNPNIVGGVFNFWGLINGGFLTTNGSAASGINYIFDKCSETPFVYNPTSQVMVSYDNAPSFLAKGNYIKNTGLAGFAMWEAGGDYYDILLDAIRSGMGVAPAG